MTTLAQINETLKLQLELMAQQREDIVKSNNDVVDLKDKISQSLQFQNKLVSQQEKSLDRVSDSIVSLKDRIAESINQQRADRLDTIEDRREARKSKQKDESMPRGFMAGLGKGIGFDWLTDFLGTLFSPAGVLAGLLAGGLGLVAGKVIKFGVIAGIIALFFSDELIAFAEGFENLTGIDLAALIAENPLIATALGVAAMMIAEWIAKSLLKGLGRALRGAVFGGPDIDDGKNRQRGQKPQPTSPKNQPPKPTSEKTTPPRDEKGRYKSKAQAPKTLPATGGSVVARGLAKVITRFLGPIGIALAAYDLINLIDVTLGLSEARQNMTPEELEQERKERGLAPGEIPTNENQSAAPNRREAFEQEQKRRAAAEKAAARVDVLRGDNPYANASLSGIDPIALQSRINAFQAYGVDRDRQRTSPTERGIARTPPSTGVGLGQLAANARMSVMINNAPQITNITNNTGGGTTSIMTVPVGTNDTSDRRDTIRRYGR